MLTTYFNGALEKELGQRFEIVTMSGPGMMRLHVAITDAEAATPGLRTVSLVIPQARLLSTIGSLGTGKQVFAGALQAEAKLTDAATGQVLAAVVTRGSAAAASRRRRSGNGATCRMRWTSLPNAWPRVSMP